MTGIVKAFAGVTLGLAVLLAFAGYARAADTQKSCNASGYILCGDGHCGARTCGGKQPGETICAPSACYMCDGCSGTWVLVGRIQQPGNRVELPVQLQGAEMPPGTPSQPTSVRPRPPVSSAPPMER